MPYYIIFIEHIAMLLKKDWKEFEKEFG